MAQLSSKTSCSSGLDKDMMEDDEVGNFFCYFSCHSSHPQFVQELPLVSCLLSGKATGESAMTTGNIQGKQGSQQPLAIYLNVRRCNRKSVQDNIPFQEARLSVLPGTYTTMRAGVDGKYLLCMTVLCTSPQNSFWYLECVRKCQDSAIQNANLTWGKRRL